MKPHFNEKYSLALRRRVIAYFKTHTARECAERFDLTHGQIIGLLETSRRSGLLPRQFKDKRTKTPWALDDWLFTIQRCGLRPREFIGKKLGRGGARVIKERLKLVNSGSKYLNGMPRSWAVELWGERAALKGFKTDAGPTGGHMASDFHFIVIPWPTCAQLARSNKTPAHIRGAIDAMARFQTWVHGVKTARGVTRKVREILNER